MHLHQIIVRSQRIIGFEYKQTRDPFRRHLNINDFDGKGWPSADISQK
jgi:hypothetical protein